MKTLLSGHPLRVLILFIVIFSIPLLLPYFHSGYFPTHDGEWAVIRLTDMYRELKDLQFPARYSGNLNFGYGYPLFEFAYPLPYYIGFLFHVFHINFVSSIKLLFGLTIPLSLGGMYLLASELWKSKSAGFVAAVLYVYYPYHLVNLFVRGSIGESISFALFPFILYFLLMIHEKRKITWTVAAGLGIAALVTTHNIMAVEFLPVIILFMIVSLNNQRNNMRQLSMLYLLTLFIGFGLSCFFWLPALAEKNFISLSLIPIADRNLYFVNVWQLIVPSWGYGVPESSDPLTYQIGVPQLIVVAVLFLSTLYYKTKGLFSEFASLLFFTYVALFIICTLLLFPFSNIIWKNTPLFKEINYPWTLLAILSFLIALLSGKVMVNRRFRLILGIAAIAAVLYCLPYDHPSSYVDRGDAFYLTNDATTTSSDEYMPLWVKQKPFQRPIEKFISTQHQTMFSNKYFNSKSFTVTSTSSVPFTLQINTIYYPGWNVFIDGQKQIIRYANARGLMQVNVGSGIHTITGKFGETLLRLIADLISIVALGSIVIILGINAAKKT